jgi:tetratricopeptide (TPR) repeat protein
MADSNDSQSQLEQVMAAVYQLLKRAEDRLNQIKDFNKHHALNHSIGYFHQELLDFTAFKEYLSSNTAVALTNDQKNSFILARALCLLALVNRVLENHDVALGLAEKALSLNPNEAKAYIEIAQSYWRLCDYDRMIVMATQAINLNPQDALGYWIRGYGFVGKNNYQAAIADFEYSGWRNPFESYIFLALGEIYYQQAKFKESIFNYSKAVNIDPTSASGFSRRGFAYLKLKQYQSAKADFEKTKELYPEFKYEVISSFYDIKPVNSQVLITFIGLCVVCFCLPSFLGQGNGFPKTILLEVTGWLLFILMFFWGKFRLQDIGLTLKKFPTGLILMFATGLVFQYTSQLLKIFTKQQNFFEPEGSGSIQLEALQIYIFYICPLLILQELFFRGFLFPQIILKLHGPYRTFTAMVAATTFAVVIQFFFLSFIFGGVVSFENTIFGLVITNYLITGIYYLTRNIYWCMGISILIFPSLQTVRPVPYVLALLITLLFLGSLYLAIEKTKSGKTNLFRENHLEDRDNKLISMFIAKRGIIYLLIFAFALSLVGMVMLDNVLSINISGIVFSMFLILAPWLIFIPEVISRLNGKSEP